MEEKVVASTLFILPRKHPILIPMSPKSWVPLLDGRSFIVSCEKMRSDSHVVAASDVLPRNRQVLVTHASGLALTALIAASPDPRGPEVYVDNATGMGGMVFTVNLTTFLLVTGYVSIANAC